MSEPLDELYFRWLCSQVVNVKLKNPARTYWTLLRQLHSKEFVWIIPNDDNRLEDGRDLRYEFVNEQEIELDEHIEDWLNLGCSMLEMLLGLARRLNFEDDNPVETWFWQMLSNLNLQRCTDKSNYDPQDVDDILDNVIWRTYEPNGDGGLFPLKNADEDQRDVELWYQFSAYFLENGG